jgi:hypothetical protein
MTVPYEIKLRAKDVIREMFRDPLSPMEPVVERALMNEWDRRLPDEIDIFRALQKRGLRKRGEIAKFIAAYVRGQSDA